MLSHPAHREKLIDLGRRLDRRGMISGTDGNLSLRSDDGRILITPSGFGKGRMAPEDLVVVSPEGRKLEGTREPSSELLMHLFAYSSRPDISACVHAHPPHATAFAVAGRQIPGDILPEAVLFVGDIPLTDFAAPGTDEVPRSLEPFISDHNAFLLRNHGLLTLGRSPEEAYNLHETVEHLAQIVYIAERIGEPQHLPAGELKRLTELRKRMLSQSDPGK